MAVPPVAGEGEGLGVGVRADVDEAAEVGLLEDDHVVGELPIAALDEVVAPRFLQDAHRPGAGVEDRVVVDVGTIDADERDGDARADEGAAGDLEVACLGVAFVFQLRSKELSPGRSAKVDVPHACILEPALQDTDLAGAALALDTGRAIRGALQVAVPDDAAVATDHVDCRSAIAPVFDRAIFDEKIRDAGQLDAVEVALDPLVSDREFAKGDMVSGLIDRAAVIDIQYVACRTLKHERFEQKVG